MGRRRAQCDTAVRLKRNQAQLYLNLAEVYLSAGRREDAREALLSGMKYARRDIRLNIAMAKLTPRRDPVFTFLERKFSAEPTLRDAAPQNAASLWQGLSRVSEMPL